MLFEFLLHLFVKFFKMQFCGSLLIQQQVCTDKKIFTDTRRFNYSKQLLSLVFR